MSRRRDADPADPGDRGPGDEVSAWLRGLGSASAKDREIAYGAAADLRRTYPRGGWRRVKLTGQADLFAERQQGIRYRDDIRELRPDEKALVDRFLAAIVEETPIAHGCAAWTRTRRSPDRRDAEMYLVKLALGLGARRLARRYRCSPNAARAAAIRGKAIVTRLANSGEVDLG